MIFSPERRARLTYLTESEASDGNRKRAIVLETRPEYAVLQLDGTNTRYAVRWEAIFQLAKTNHERNLRLEAVLRRKKTKIR